MMSDLTLREGFFRRKYIILSEYILLGVILVLLSVMLNARHASAEEWTGNFSSGKMRGVISKDGKKCWIQEIEGSMIQENVLKIPSKVKGAEVVRIGRPRDVEGESYNILKNSWDWCNAELSKKASALKEVVIPDTVEYIDDHCFMMLSGIKTIKLPKKLKEIGAYAFLDCYSLKTLKLPQGLEVIGDYALKGCRRLKNLSIGKKVNEISHNVFIGCISLKKVTIHKKNSRYRVKSGCIYNKGKNRLFLIYAQKKVFSVPKGVKIIPENCLQSGTVEVVKIPGSVKEIRNDAFGVNQKLEIVVSKKNKTFKNIKKHVVKISDGTLVCMDAYDKRSINLPKGIEIVQEDMSIIGDSGDIAFLTFPSTLKLVKLTPHSYTKFYHYFELQVMRFKGKKPPVFTSSFGCDNIIYVPKGSKAAYVKAFKDKNKVREK